MHSKSYNLGYLKDREWQIFRGLRHLAPHQGSALGPLGGGKAQSAVAHSYTEPFFVHIGLKL